MEIQANNSTLSHQTLSTANQLNLNLDRLQIPSLMENATYRRLTNIVYNDEQQSDHQFRKNLIKQLYFLLQITPIIKEDLKQKFLEQIQKWYNLNDHKKIQLASNQLVNLYHFVKDPTSKTTKNLNLNGSRTDNRPKTGIRTEQWNQNLPTFLRPYTAKTKASQQKSKNRPQSSKKDQQSTTICNEQFHIRDFTTQIHEQLEISQDFIQKRRTNHPEYEPVYERLYKILKKVENQPQAQPPTITKKKKNRFVKSALPFSKPKLDEDAKETKDIPKDKQQEIHQLIRQDTSSCQSQTEEFQHSQSHKKAFVCSTNTQNQIKPKIDYPNLYKYNHIIRNKTVQASIEDHSMVNNYVSYARIKSAMRKQISRKMESKRLMSAKTGGKSEILMHQASNKENTESKEVIEEQTGAKIVDLKNDELNIKKEEIIEYPQYNQRSFLKKMYQNEIPKYKRINLNTQSQVKMPIRPMTANLRYRSPLRFDPFSQENIKKYNEQNLEQIQKIKQKVGGKLYVSSQNLMKGLMIDADIQQDTQWWKRDIGFNMLSKGEKKKKMKKKGRKLVKNGPTKTPARK